MLAEFILAGWLSFPFQLEGERDQSILSENPETKAAYKLVLPEGSFGIYPELINSIETPLTDVDPDFQADDNDYIANDVLLEKIRRIISQLFYWPSLSSEDSDPLALNSTIDDKEQEPVVVIQLVPVQKLKPRYRLVMPGTGIVSVPGSSGDSDKTSGNNEGKDDQDSDQKADTEQSEGEERKPSEDSDQEAEDGSVINAVEPYDPLMAPDFSKAPDHDNVADIEQLIAFYKKHNMVFSYGTFSQVAWDQYPRLQPRMYVAVKYNSGQKEGLEEDSQKTTYQSLLQEWRILKKLKHEHIVRLIYVLNAPDRSRIVLIMESYPYRLREVIDAPEMLANREELSGLMSPVGYLSAMVSLINAFLYLHELDMLYPDTKSTNILFDQYGDLKLIDFNLIYRFSQPEVMPKAANSYYLAPEVRREEPFGEPAESFGVGLMLVQLLTGLYLECSEDIDQQLEDKKQVVHKYNDLSFFLSDQPETVRVLLAKVLDVIAFPACDDKPENRPLLGAMSSSLNELISNILDYMDEQNEPSVPSAKRSCP